MYARQGTAARDSAGRQTRDVLLRTLREREPDLHDHLAASPSWRWRSRASWACPARSSTSVARAAELHDVGKIAIPDAILDKPGPLDEAEWDFMRRHTVIGERILAAAPALRPVARLVRSSHERWDGARLPRRPGRRRIPLGARIVAVCDAYEAMVVRPALPHRRCTPERPSRSCAAAPARSSTRDVVEASARALASGRAEPLTAEPRV